MSLLRLIIFTIAIIASCNASGIGHFLPSIKSVPVVRYTPFYNFPGGVRSIHAVAPGFPVAPAFPAPPAPVLPAPFGAPAFLAAPPVFPSPVPLAPASFLPSPALPAPVVPPAPVYAQYVPRFAPAVPALPPATFFAGGIPTVPFAPVVRAVAPGVPVPPPLFTPSVAPAPVAVARALPFGLAPHLHAYNRFLAPAPVLPAQQAAWK